MIGIYVTVPVACFRKGMAREYLETEPIPPPATCYGFLLSLVGETDRQRHIGARVTPALIGKPECSVVLRTVWRVKNKPLGSSGNTRPDFQQLLTGISLVIWLDSSDETGDSPRLEDRVNDALHPTNRKNICRFGGLSLGESTHMVDEVSIVTYEIKNRFQNQEIKLYCLKDQGLLGLPVWVDHVGSEGTAHVVGDLISQQSLTEPVKEQMPLIQPKSAQ